MRTKSCSNKNSCCHNKGPSLPLSEFGNRANSVDGLQHKCKLCTKAYRKQYRKDNPDYFNLYYAKNKDSIIARANQWNSSNPEKRKAITKSYRINNVDKVNLVQKDWRINNPAKNNAKSAKYRASKMQRTPKWLTLGDLKRMERKYEMSHLMTEFLGVKYHVDHIVPLQGDMVSGLHVPDNLQILLASDNLGKSNTFN